MNHTLLSKWKTLLILTMCILSALACGAKKDPEDTEDQKVAANVQVDAVRVEQGAIRQIVQVSGTLNALPNQDIRVSALVPGRLNELPVSEGDPVVAGQIIAKLDDSSLKDQLRAAAAALENARQNEERTTKLFDRGIAAGKEKEDAHRDMETAQAAFDSAQLQVKRTAVVSPIRGMVVKRLVNVGEQVDGTAGEPILEIANFDPIELDAELQTAFLEFVHEGQDASVHTDAFGETIFPGKVVAILPAVNPTTNAATIRIRMTNTDLRLKGGMFATASIIAATKNDALYVPPAALVTANNVPRVFVVGSDSKAHETPVKVGWRDGDRIEIVDGVKQGDLVVTTGSYGLADKMNVTVKK